MYEMNLQLFGGGGSSSGLKGGGGGGGSSKSSSGWGSGSGAGYYYFYFTAPTGEKNFGKMIKADNKNDAMKKAKEYGKQKGGLPSDPMTKAMSREEAERFVEEARKHKKK